MPITISVTVTPEPDNDRHRVVIRQGSVSTTLFPTPEIPELLPQSIPKHQLFVTLSNDSRTNVFNLIFSEMKNIVDISDNITWYGQLTLFREFQVEFGVPTEVKLPF